MEGIHESCVAVAVVVVCYLKKMEGGEEGGEGEVVYWCVG